tara:strand:- start:85961 stop:86959 length:999 start_codon:yes stop_codon:yes gene_type:complete
MSESKFKVVITDFINDSLAIERQILDPYANLIALDAKHVSESHGHIDNADAIMMYHNLSVAADTIARLQKCKIIVRCGVGFDNVDLDAARGKSIPVVNIPDYGTEEVADSAIGMMLALTRGINRYNIRMRQSDPLWTYESAAPLVRLRGQVLGIVGLGRIGIATAKRAMSLGMDVRFYDPYIPDGMDKAIGVTREESLEALMRQSLVLSLHCPLTSETHQMINRESLRWLPTGAYLVNTARGGIVDTAVLPDAVASGQIAGAAVDVLPNEPPADDDPLLVAWRDPSHPAHERIIVNPHAAFYCEEGLQDMRRKSAEACRRMFEGEPIRNQVN